MPDYSHKIVIAGTGLSGLSAGVYLKRQGYNNITFVESTDKIGGRMKTDIIDGYTLDKGFHVFFTAYPYAKEVLNYEALNLKYFDSGALIMKEGRLIKMIDPFHHPLALLKAVFSKVGTFADKVKLVKRRIELGKLTENQIFEKFEVKTSSILKKKKFSNRIIKNFFQPLFSGIFMENELRTSRRIFDYYLKMMTEGKVSIPAEGIQAIPNQLAQNFEKDNFIFNKSAVDYKDKKVMLNTGETIDADIFVIATERNSLFLSMKKEEPQNDHTSTTCLYFSASKKPFAEPMVCLNANNPKLISNIVVLTNISKAFAPHGHELISVSINGYAKAENAILESEVKDELKRAFGKEVYNWQLLKVYRIEYALPNQDYVLGKRQMNELKLGENIYACGDHLLYGSINAAIKSGKMVSEIIHRDFNSGHKIQKKKRYDGLFD
jgi:protoporphyrinogen oxidase